MSDDDMEDCRSRLALAHCSLFSMDLTFLSGSADGFEYSEEEEQDEEEVDIENQYYNAKGQILSSMQ